jgi:asparagine synthase (glutamine-hydrolysing)
MYRKLSGIGPLDQVLYVYCKYWLADNLLTKADRMTMANSIELRVPFLDHDMIEQAFMLPDNERIHLTAGLFNAKRKAILRDSMKGKVPEVILQRKKYGFPSPENVWIKNELRDYARDTLFAHRSLTKSMFQISEIENLFLKSQAEDLRAQIKLWILLVLETWYKVFI